MRYRLHFRLSLTSAVSPTHELIFTHGSMSKMSSSVTYEGKLVLS